MLESKYSKLDLILLNLVQGRDGFHNNECGNIIGESEIAIGRLKLENYHLENDLKESESNGELNTIIDHNNLMIKMYTRQKNAFIELKDDKRPVSYLK